MKKDILTVTVKECYDLFTMEKDRINANGHTSNTAKNLSKIDFVCRLLAHTNSNLTITIEGCKGDGKIRDFNLPNAGSVVECLFNHHFHREPTSYECKHWNGEQGDGWTGCLEHEVKASCSANTLATPSTTSDNFTYLVNWDGVYKLKKCLIMNFTNNQGRLPYRETAELAPYRVGWLSYKMGLTGEEEEEG